MRPEELSQKQDAGRQAGEEQNDFDKANHDEALSLWLLAFSYKKLASERIPFDPSGILSIYASEAKS
jgi:hypothetical protein